jgi:cytochrome c oxidase subunit 2
LGRPSPSHRRRAIVFSLLGVLALALSAAAPASANFFWPEAGGSPNADDIQTLYKIVLGVAVVVFAGVEGALLYALIKFRARKGAVAAQIRGNTRLEIGWTVGAAVILVVLSVVTFAMLPSIDNPPDSKVRTGVLVADATKRLPPNGQSLNICVNGQQYIWRYTYETNCADAAKQNLKPFSYEEMVVPTGVTVTLDIVSQDVAHSWWIPQLGGKFDAIPGYTNHTWFQVPESKEHQVFTGQCAELCGRNHADMTARVLALSYPDWKLWLANQTKNIAAADVLAQAQRAALVHQEQAGHNTAAAGTITPTIARPATPTTTSTTAAPAGNAAQLAAGKAVFTGASGCGGCHTLADAGTNGQIGPNLDTVLKGKDAAFITQSIVSPDAVIAKGFTKGIMPSNFKSSLSKAQLTALVAYLASVTSK